MLLRLFSYGEVEKLYEESQINTVNGTTPVLDKK